MWYFNLVRILDALSVSVNATGLRSRATIVEAMHSEVYEVSDPRFQVFEFLQLDVEPVSQTLLLRHLETEHQRSRFPTRFCMFLSPMSLIGLTSTTSSWGCTSLRKCLMMSGIHKTCTTRTAVSILRIAVIDEWSSCTVRYITVCL